MKRLEKSWITADGQINWSPLISSTQGCDEQDHRDGSWYERGLEEDVVGLYQGKNEGQGIESEQTLRLPFERQI